jgi:acetyl esterase/lipase
MPVLLVMAVLAFAWTDASAQMTSARDIPYDGVADHPEGRDLLDVYMPEGAEDVPVMVFFHGGALVGGQKDDGEALARRLTAMGIGVVSATYRMSPEVSHPVHTQDAARAVAWVSENIAAHGGDPGRLVLAGHSAGAYLAALLALDPGYLDAVGVDRGQVAGTVLVSPFLYVEETAPDRIARNPVFETIWGTDPDAWLAASVSPHIGPDRDDVLMIYADGDDDWRKAQNETLAAALQAAGNANVRAVEVPNRTHVSLMTDVGAGDDRIGDLVRGFVFQER